MAQTRAVVSLPASGLGCGPRLSLGQPPGHEVPKGSHSLGGRDHKIAESLSTLAQTIPGIKLIWWG